MAIGIVSNTDFELELVRLTGNNKPEIQEIQKGRGEGNTEVPESLRKVIGETAIEEGSKEAKEITKAFGISDSSLAAYKTGAHSSTTYHTPNPDLKNHLDRAKTRIGNKARNTLLKAINNITAEKLEDAGARELSSIAKDMSAIIRNIEPAPEIQNNQTNFIMYAPKPRDESDYEIVEVKE